jgi:hypothetical protein
LRTAQRREVATLQRCLLVRMRSSCVSSHAVNGIGNPDECAMSTRAQSLAVLTRCRVMAGRQPAPAPGVSLLAPLAACARHAGMLLLSTLHALLPGGVCLSVRVMGGCFCRWVAESACSNTCVEDAANDGSAYETLLGRPLQGRSRSIQSLYKGPAWMIIGSAGIPRRCCHCTMQACSTLL